MTPSQMTRVRNRPGVVFMMRRSKMSCSWEGCPKTTLSLMMCSKNCRPVIGRSKTWVRENSACRMDRR